MRKVSLLLILVSFIACNSDNEAKVQAMSTKDSSAVQHLNYPPFDNTITFEFADPRVAAGMFEVYKGWEDNNMELMKKHFADTAIVVGGDGSEAYGSKDSVFAVIGAYRNNYVSMKPRFHTFVALKSLDRDATWFLMWYKEFQTDKKGKTDSVELQENWKLNKDGKIVALYQYMQTHPEPGKK